MHVELSLTVNEIEGNTFAVSIIPHTAAITTIGLKQVGDKVNIETDMLGKYVKKILKGSISRNDAMPEGQREITMELLAKNGFLT